MDRLDCYSTRSKLPLFKVARPGSVGHQIELGVDELRHCESVLIFRCKFVHIEYYY